MGSRTATYNITRMKPIINISSKELIPTTLIQENYIDKIEFRWTRVVTGFTVAMWLIKWKFNKTQL
jgi:hypothetical protein